MMGTKYLIFIRYFFLIILTTYPGCSYRTDQANKSTAIREEINQGAEKALPEFYGTQSYRLWHTIDQFELDRFHFFGGFYEDRLKFYYRDNPELQIGDANVKLIMLYFLDDRLVKVRYHLDRNIERYLMDSLGIGNLDTKYTRKTKTLATERSLKKLKEFNLSHNVPDEYGISWDRYIISSSFQVNGYLGKQFAFDTISSKYIYIDQLKSYRKRLIEIENQRIARMKGDTSIVGKM
jgi:hypothetical protein